MAKKSKSNSFSYPTDRGTQYALDVVAGTIIAGPLVRAACHRHLEDLKKAEDGWDYYYDLEEAAESIAFFEEVLCLNGGQFEGKPFLLFPWQAFVISSLFAWKRHSDGTRRFRVAFAEQGKGNGKSPTAAGIGLKGLVADNEERAEIYAAACFRDQAMVLFRDACAFFDQSPELQKRLKASGVGEKRWNLSYPAANSFFRVISSEKKGQSGPRPHIALLDEIHEFPDGNIIEMLRAGFKFRRQPLSFMITNSGSDKTSVCWEYHDMGAKVATGVIENEEFFSFICSLDEEDLVDDKYLEDESVWIKANPSLPYGIPGYDYIRQQVKEARSLPSKMSTVKRLCFCVWTEADNPWLSGDLWFGCQDKDVFIGFSDENLVGRRCWGGLDLSSTQDLTAFALLFEPTVSDPFWRLKCYFWIPGDNLMAKEDLDHVPYTVWRDKGHLTALPGKAINKSSVVKIMAEIANKFDLQFVAYDRAKMKDMSEHAEKAGIELTFGTWDKDKKKWIWESGDGVKMAPFGQESRSMDPAISKFEGLLANKQLLHDGNPVLTWCAANAVTIEDEDKNRKISKKKSTGRVDGIVASVMAAGVADEKATEKSAYDGLSEEEIIAMMTGKTN